MTATYTPLANVTLTASASSVTFSSIPATYRDLILVCNGITASSNTPTVRFNADATSNYSLVGMRGDGSTTESFSATTTQVNLVNLNTTPASQILQIMDYAQTNKHKSMVQRRNDPAIVFAYAWRWGSTSAINTMTFTGIGGANLQSGTTLALYGIIA